MKEIQIKPLNQSVAQIRAHKELSSLNSQHKLQSSSVHDMASQPNVTAS